MINLNQVTLKPSSLAPFPRDRTHIAVADKFFTDEMAANLCARLCCGIYPENRTKETIEQLHVFRKFRKGVCAPPWIRQCYIP